MLTKTCTKCGQTLALEAFYRYKDGPLGRTSKCRLCSKKRTRDYYRKNAARMIARLREYERRHPEKRRKHARAYRLRNLEKTRAAVGKWARDHPEKKREINRAYERRRQAERRFFQTLGMVAAVGKFERSSVKSVEAV